MKCPGSEAWLEFYGGEKDEDATPRMAAHLQECRPCQEEFDRLSRLGAELRGLPAPRLRLARRRRVRVTWDQSNRWVYPVAAALLIGVLAFVLRSPALPSPVEAPVARTIEPPAEPSPPPAPPPPTFRKELPRDDFQIPVAPPLPPKVEAPAPIEEPAPAPPRDETKSAVAIATFERNGGSQPIIDGQAVKGRGVVKFSDGTRMELADATSIARISDRVGAGGVGKWVDLTEGPLVIEAAHQPADRAMTIATPHGEACIVGTTLRLAVEKESTRLEVAEGRVRLSRSGAAVDVIGGHFAVAAEGVELAARPLPKMVAETVLAFAFEDGHMPKGIEAGAVERGPDRPGSRFCIAGAQIPGGTAGGHVKLSSEDAKGLFVYADDLVLSFDYWADDSVRTLDFHMWSRVHQTTFGTTIWNTPRERWTHLVIPLNDFIRSEADRLLHLKPGEAMPYLWIQAGQPGGKLYLDNLEIVRMRPPPVRPKR